MAKTQEPRTPKLSIVDISEKIRDLSATQLRVIILLMASGHNFAEAYQVAAKEPTPS